MRTHKNLNSRERWSDTPLSTVGPSYVFSHHTPSNSPIGIAEIDPKSCGNCIVEAYEKIRRLTVLTVDTASTRHSFEQSRRDVPRCRRPRVQAVTWVGVLLAVVLFAAPSVGAQEVFRVSVTAESAGTGWVGCEANTQGIRQCRDRSGNTNFRYPSGGTRYAPRDFRLGTSSRTFQFRFLTTLGDPEDLISTELTLSVNGTVLNFDEASAVSSRSGAIEWTNTSVSFSSGNTVTLVIEEPNNAPTTSDSSVTTDEDTNHTFSATDFPFNDTDSGASLSSVTIATLPEASLGTLQLSGTAVSANGQVTRAQLDAGNLQFIPVADANGNTTFMFTVNDGEDDSADAATMTVNVTAVNDAPTGLPTISGNPFRGATLTASTTGISDADGPANIDFTFQWLRVDADGTSNETAIAGATSMTYTTTVADEGKRIRVRVAFTDEGGTAESLTSDAHPSSGTIQGPTLRASIQNVLLDEFDPTDRVSTISVNTFPGPTFADNQTVTLTLGGTATKDQDYQVNAESLVLPAGSSRLQFTITVLDDIIREDEENVLVTVLHNGIQIGNVFDITIGNDDPTPSLVLSTNRASIDEDGGVATVTVSTGTGSTFPDDQTIELTLSGSATLTDDYTIGPTTLTLPAGMGTNPSSVTTTITAVDDEVFEGPTNEQITITGTRGGASFGSPLSISIDENEETPELKLDLTDFEISENGGTTTVTATVAPAVADAFTAEVSISPRDHATTADYTQTGDTLNFAALAENSTGTVTITAINNRVFDIEKTLDVRITSSLAYFRAAQSEALTLEEDDGAPSLVFEVDTTTIPEASGTAMFTVRTGTGSTFSEDQTISLTLGGTATLTTDYELTPSTTLTLPAGTGIAESRVTATVTAVQDNLQDPGETVIVTARHGSNDVGTPQTVTIEDDDTLAWSVSVTNPSIVEAGGTSTVTVDTGGSTFTTDQTITLTLAGTATKNSDYTIGAETLTLAANTTEVSTVITAVQDTVDDNDETVIITASHNSTTIGTSQTVTITESNPTLSVSITATNIPEAAGTSTLTVSTGSGPAFATDQTITLTLAGTATQGTDYTIVPTSLTLTAGQTEVTATVTAVQDSIVEGNETVLITVMHGTTTIGTQQTVTIDDDDAVGWTVGVAPANIPEAAGVSTLTVNTGGATFTSDQIIMLTLGGTATKNTDYTIGAESLTLTAGQMEVTTTVTAVQDSLAEGDETVEITAMLGSATIGTQQTVTIDDDDTIAWTVGVNATSIAEAAGVSTLTVNTGGATFTTDQTITLTLAGSAAKVTDYTIGTESLTLTAGQTEVTTTVTAVQDVVIEGEEDVLITATHESATLGSQQRVVITDDDAADWSVTVTVNSMNATNIAEAAGVATLTVRTGGAVFQTDQSIDLSILGTATLDDDYTVGTFALTLTAGSSSVSTNITAVQDTIDEDDETVAILATLVSPPSEIGDRVTITINDDDAPPALEVRLQGAANIAEAQGNIVVSITTGSGSSFPDDQTISLEFGGSASLTADYTSDDTTLTLPAGRGSSGSFAFTRIRAVQDNIDEPDEMVTVRALRGGVAFGTQTITINDDDQPPVLELIVTSASIDEAGGSSTIRVRTGSGSTFVDDQTIELTLSGTATLTDDYTIGATTLTLPAGRGTSQSRVDTTVTAVDDDFFEGTTNEQITISGTHGGNSFGSARSISITENELAPVLTVRFTDPDDSISENGGTTNVTASVSPRTVDAFTADVSITPLQHATSADYTLTGLTLSFAALATDSTGTVTITANDNRVDQPDKAVRVDATSSLAYFRTNPDPFHLVIEDDDAPPAPILQVTGSPFGENGGVATLTVTTDDGSTFPDAQTVQLELSGSATEIADYRILSKNLVLPAGQGLQVSTVSTTLTGVDDIIDEVVEEVLIDASIGGNAVGTQQTAVISDDDDPPVLALRVPPAPIPENGGTATITVTTDDGTSTFATDQTINLTYAGTAVQGADYSPPTTSLTLPAGVGLAHSSVTTTITALDDRIDEADTETVLVDATRSGSAVGTQQTLTIADDDAAPELQFTATATQINEQGGTSTLTVSTGTGSTFEDEQTIELTVTDGTAVRNSDYSVSPTTLTLPAGAGLNPSSVTAVASGEDDPNFEGLVDQTFTVEALLGGVSIGPPLEIAIDDDESASKPTLVAEPDTMVEGTGTRSDISATVSPPAELGFWIRVDLPLEHLDHFLLSAPGILGGSRSQYAYIEFAPGATASVPREFWFTPTIDDDATGDFEFTLTGEPVGYDLGGARELPNPVPGILSAEPVTVTIEDDDVAALTVELSVDVGEVVEGGPATTVTVTGTASQARAGSPMTVMVTVGSGVGDAGAVSGADFTAVETFDLTIAAGQTVGEASFSLEPLEDNIDEPLETVAVSGSSTDGSIGVEGTTITITDNDDAPALVLAVLPDSIDEDGGIATVTVSTGEGSTFASAQTVTLSLTGTATQGSDYTVGPTSLQLPAGTGTAAAQVSTTITAVDDNTAEGTETVIVNGSLGTEAFGEAQTVEIVDDEGTPEVTLVLTPPAVPEGGSSTMTATVSPASELPFTVDIAATPVSPTVVEDFTLTGSTLSFAPGAISSTGSVTIDTVDNTVDTPDREVLVSGTVSTTDVIAPGDETLTILDNEGEAVLTLEVAPLTLAEAGGTATVTVTTGTGATFDTDQVIVLVFEGTAVLNEDYSINATELTLPAGESNVTATITGIDDVIFETEETILITGQLGGEPFGTQLSLPIADDEAAPSVTLVLTPASIDENGGTAVVSATASVASAQPYTVTVVVAPNAPATDEDFTVAGDTLNFAANATASTGEVTITAVDNDVVAGDRTLLVSGTASREDVTAPSAVQLTIVEDDEASNTVTLSMTPNRIDEDALATQIEVTGTLDSGAAQTDIEISLTLVRAGLAASPGVDYETVADFNLIVPANTSIGTTTFTLTPLEDRIDEVEETVTLIGRSLISGIAVVQPDPITIVDNDDPPMLALAVSPTTIGENGGIATITVTSDTGSTFPDARTIEFTVAGTATQDEDYRLGASTATLPAGVGMEPSVVNVTVTALDDTMVEERETILIDATMDGVAIGTQQTLNITDDDVAGTTAVTLVLSPASIQESGGVSTVTATVSPAATAAFTVTVMATAVAPAMPGDFTLMGTTLAFAAGATASTGDVTITAVDNEDDAPDKTVTVSGMVSDGSVRAPADEVLTILDDDEPTTPVQRGVTISPTQLSVNEGDTNGGTYQVSLIAEPSENVTISVMVPSASAVAADPSQFTLTPSNWQTAQTVTVTAQEDDDTDDDTVTLTHTATGAGYEDVVISPVVVTVIDRIDPGLPGLRIADARGTEAAGQLRFEMSLDRATTRAVSVAYTTRDGTAMAGEDYEASAGTVTIGAGATSAHIVVPLLMDLFSELDESFSVMLSQAEGARLVDADAIGTIEAPADDDAASQRWLAQFGRIAGGQVMTAIGEQLTVSRDRAQVTVAGSRLNGGVRSGSRTAPVHWFGQDGLGLAPPGGWQAAPSHASAGHAFGPSGSRSMRNPKLLLNSDFVLNAGPDGGRGVSLWGRGNYTRFDNLGEDLKAGGNAVSATLGIDRAWERYVLGIALSRSEVEADYGGAAQVPGELQSSVTGLYPYFGAQLTERFSIWGLVGRGRGELVAKPTADVRAAQVDLDTRVTGFGAKGKLLAPGNGFSLAVKADTLLARTRTGAAEGILAAEGEHRRVRLGLEGAWLRELGEHSSLRTMLEVAAREDAGETQNGRGVEVVGGMEFIDVAPGLSFDLAVRGLLSHEVEDYEEWGVAGGFRYDPEPGTAVGPLVSLTQWWQPAGGGLRQTLWRDNLAHPLTPSSRSQAEMLSMAFAYGFEAFGVTSVPWARLGQTSRGDEARLGYSLVTSRGMPSLELIRSTLGREYRIGWQFALPCRAHVAVEVLHPPFVLGKGVDTGIEVRFRSVLSRPFMDRGNCTMPSPLFASGGLR